jgi:hypothetical protein
MEKDPREINGDKINENQWENQWGQTPLKEITHQ